MVTNEDDGHRTEIGSDELLFSENRTLGMPEESDVQKSCTEVYSTTNDKTQTEVPKSVKTSKKRAVDAEIVANTQRMTLHNIPSKILPLKKKTDMERRRKSQAILT